MDKVPIASLTRNLARLLIRVYQLTVSAIVGRHCRHLPTCSHYTDEAIARHGLWAGGWMGAARICRCHPWGTDGFDPAPATIPPDAAWYRPWRYGRWGHRGTLPDETGPDATGLESGRPGS